jgi:hypothetical protein
MITTKTDIFNFLIEKKATELLEPGLLYAGS